MSPEPFESMETRYTLQAVVEITGVQRETLVQYCESGLLPLPAKDLEKTDFDDHLVCSIRRIEFLRQAHGVNLAGIRMITELLAEVERLQKELIFARDASI